jgi:hypothetical protein
VTNITPNYEKESNCVYCAKKFNMRAALANMQEEMTPSIDVTEHPSRNGQRIKHRTDRQDRSLRVLLLILQVSCDTSDL